MAATISILVILLAFLGTPLLAVLGLLGAINFAWVSQVPLQAMITKVYGLMAAPGILALPLFTFMGYILTETKSPERLARFFNAWLGWVPGGLALTTILAYTAFSAMTGGSALAIMALGGIFFASLLESGYDKKFALGICTAAGSEGIMLPPSIPVIIIAFLAYESIEAVYVGGIGPSILAVGLLTFYASFKGRKTGAALIPFSSSKALAALVEVLPEVPLPAIVLVGLFSGWLNIVEIATLALVYTLIVEVVLRRELSLEHLKAAARQSMVLVGAIFSILVSALAFSNFLVDFEVPQKFLAFLQGLITSKLVFLLFLNVILLITGCLMDVFSAVLVMVPLLLPVSKGFGIDPIHFCVIFLWNMEIGFSTPPIGFNLFVANFRFHEPLEKLWAAVMPILGLKLLALIIITYWLDLTLWLPRSLGMRQELIEFF
jgi:tripartite ATP-independent transporter DctM subunit